MRFQELAKLRVGVWGAGKEGCSIIHYLQQRFPDKPLVLIDDQQPPPSLLAELSQHGGLDFMLASELNHATMTLDVIIKSPGVSRYRPEIARARQLGIYLTTATNLWLAEVANRTRVIAVTGTKGKSTTASVLAFILEKAGLNVALAGNIGIPLTDLLVHDQHFDWVVAELSSYQLSDLDVWPELGIMLNLYPEHIDWHGSTANYYQDKLRLFAPEGHCLPVVNFADATVRAAIGAADPVMYFNAPSAIHVHDNDIMDGELPLLSGADLKLRGQHNLINICAALTVARYLGVAIADVAPRLAEFNGLAHRLELIGTYNGITYVDDSISTTPESTMAALAAYPGQTITLLLGGKDRQQDFTAFARYVSEHRLFAIITMHENGNRIAQEISAELQHQAYAPIIKAEKDLPAALAQAKAITPPGGIILLSPASPSYDAYKNFQERGEVFRRLAEG